MGLHVQTSEHHLAAHRGRSGHRRNGRRVVRSHGSHAIRQRQRLGNRSLAALATALLTPPNRTPTIGSMTSDPGAPRMHAPVPHWDAGAMGCGELILELRTKMRELPPGGLFQLTAHDPGAIVDLPAWCGLVGHRLVRAEPPVYLLERKSD